MIEVIVVAYMFSFVASTGVRAVVMSQFICIAPSPRPHGDATYSYLLRIIIGSSRPTALTLVLKQQKKHLRYNNSLYHFITAGTPCRDA